MFMTIIVTKEREKKYEKTKSTWRYLLIKGRTKAWEHNNKEAKEEKITSLVASRNGFNALMTVNDIIRSFSQAFCFRIDDYSLIFHHFFASFVACFIYFFAVATRNATMLFVCTIIEYSSFLLTIKKEKHTHTWAHTQPNRYCWTETTVFSSSSKCHVMIIMWLIRLVLRVLYVCAHHSVLYIKFNTFYCSTLVEKSFVCHHLGHLILSIVIDCHSRCKKEKRKYENGWSTIGTQIKKKYVTEKKA